MVPSHRNKRVRVSRKLECFHCHLASHVLVLKRHLMAFRGERENGRRRTVYLHKCWLEAKSVVDVVVVFTVCLGCSCFSEEGAGLLTTTLCLSRHCIKLQIIGPMFCWVQRWVSAVCVVVGFQRLMLTFIVFIP